MSVTPRVPIARERITVLRDANCGLKGGQWVAEPEYITVLFS